MTKINFIVFFIIGMISIILVTVFCMTFIPSKASILVKNNLKYGDLYQMAKITNFKSPLPSSLPPKQLSSIQDADIIIMGDSFFNVSAGYNIFAEQIEQKLGKKVHNYNIQGSGELWRKTNPLDYLKENNFKTDDKKRILILESVDRGLKLRFENIKKTNSQSKIVNEKDRKLPDGSIEIINIKDNNLHLEGWGADMESGSPLKKIDIIIDDKTFGQAILSFQRPDIVLYYKNNSWLNSGWSYSQYLNLPSGKHSLKVIFYDNNNNKKILGPKYFFIKNGTFIKLTNKIYIIDSLIKNKLKSIDFLFQENPISIFILENINTIKFNLFRQISPLTPRYSINPNILFYKEEVEFYKNPPPEDEIASIAANIKYISDQLKNEYNIDLFFLPMPTKYSIYHNLVGDFSTNYFFRDLFKVFDEFHINYIDLYTDFKESKKILYFPSDTHWNKYGIEIGINKVIEAIKNN